LGRAAEMREMRWTCRRWVADQADVSQELEFEAVGALLAGAAEFVLARAWWVGVAKCWLPRPPRPPLATTMRSSGSEKS